MEAALLVAGQGDVAPPVGGVERLRSRPIGAVGVEVVEAVGDVVGLDDVELAGLTSEIVIRPLCSCARRTPCSAATHCGTPESTKSEVTT